MSDEEFSLISRRQWSSLTKSEFAQVIFHDVQEWYPTDGDVKCCFVLSNLMSVTDNDKVGLYRVGWSDPTQYITCKDVTAHPEATDQSEELSVLFSVNSLPKDDGEFYQFCYLTASNQIRGASTPFKFQRARNEDLVEIAEESDDDMMIVCSRTAVVEDKLRKANAELQILTKENYRLQKENELVQKNVKSLGEDLANFKISNDQLKEDIKTKEENINTLEKLHAEDDIKRVKYHECEVEKLLDQINGLKKEMGDLQHSRQIFVQECDKLKDQLENLESNKMADIQKVLDEEQMKRESVESSFLIIKDDQDEIINNFKHMLEASEQSKSMVLQEKQALQEFNTKLCSDMENLKSEMYNYKQEWIKCSKQQLQAQKEVEESNKTIESLKTDVTKLELDIKDKKEMIVNIEADLMEIREDYAIERRSNIIMQRDAAMDKKEIERLRAKVREGASEYQSKYVLSLKLQKKVYKLADQVNELEEKLKEATTEKPSVCKTMSAFAGGGSLTPGDQTLSAALSMSNGTLLNKASSEAASANTDDNSSVVGQAEGFTLLKCPVCEKSYSTENGSTLLLNHLEHEHNVRMCPVCSLIFDEKHPYEFFSSHVNQHFDAE